MGSLPTTEHDNEFLPRSWPSIRRLIWRRDNGTCQVCNREVSDYFECGHIVDRVAGGSDLPSNLVTMCYLCNRLKPIHETREQYVAWLEAGDWRAELRELLGM